MLRSVILVAALGTVLAGPFIALVLTAGASNQDSRILQAPCSYGGEACVKIRDVRRI